MTALLLLGGSGLAWGQAGTATVVWDASHDQSGQNLGLDNNLTLEIDGTVEVSSMVQIISDIRVVGGTKVTIKPKNGTSTCTIKRAAGYTGIMFNLTSIGAFPPGYLYIDPGVTFDGNGSNVTATSPMIVVDNGGLCNPTGSATNPVRFINTNGEVAIWNQFALTCTYTEFSNCTTAINGGAVRNYSSPSQTIPAAASFTNCTFTNNTAKVGGAIFNTTSVTCLNCNFTGNKAINLNELGGGAIISDDNNSWTAQTTLNQCRFEDNTAYNGGAVLAWGLLDCDNCTFYDNHAVNTYNLAGPGGAVYYGGSQSASQSFTLDNCIFDSNDAQFRGGAILVYRNSTSYARCVITNTDFYNNESMQGGAIVVHDSGAEVTFNSGKIYNNRAVFVSGNPSGSGQGAGVFVDGGSTFTMEGGEIGIAGTNGGNSAYYKGGGVYTAGTFNYNGGDIYYNEATDGGTRGDGGGVYVAGGTFNLISGQSITKNTAVNGGGIYIKGGELNVYGTVGGSTADKNTATNGGGIFADGGTMNLNNGAVVSYNQGTNGAGVYVNSGYGNFMKAGSNINNNTGATNGGGVYINGGMLQMQGGDIHHHTATYGGGVYVNTDGQLYQTGGRIGYQNAANTATDGGGVYALGDASFSGGTVSYNTTTNANGRGAGVFVAGGTTTQNGYHVIEHNSVANNGAGVFVNGGIFQMTADGGIVNHFIRNHSAINGAGVYVNTNGTFKLSGGYVGQNGAANAATLGGGVYLNGGTFTMTGGNIIYNTASQDGAGVHIASGTMNYEGAGAIEHNTATRNGGGVYVAGTNATLNMKNTKIQLNTAVNGGGVYVNANGTFTMWGTDTSHACELVSNTVTSGNGGGLYHKGTTTVTGLIHINNNTGNRASNNAYLDQSGTVRYLYIGEPGLLCGSDIAIKNNTTGMEIARGTGSNSVAVANAQYAYRNKFFRSDVGLDVYTDNAGGFNANSKSLYIFTANTSSIFYNLVAQSPTDYEASGGFITKVKTIAGLAYLAYDVNVEGVDYEGHTVTLENDVTLPTGRDWEPIGYRLECGPVPFKGTFDGQFHVIYGIKSDLGYLDAGLFGYTDGATIKNVLMDANYGCSASENLGGLIGYMHGGTVNNCEVRSSLTSGSGYVSGGLVGRLDNNGTIHSSCAMPTFTGSTGAGLVGQMTSGSKLHNCFVNTTTASKGLVANNAGEVRNCYARGVTVANLVGGTAAQYCYASSGSASGNNGVFGATALVNGKYGFAHQDQQISGGSATYVTNGAIDNNGELKGLLATLNKWVGSSTTYSRWTRTMGSSINGDYPVLMFADTKCVGSKDGTFMDYATDLNPMITAYNINGSGDIYLYAVPSTINVNTASNVRVYINEKVGVQQATGNRINARTGVTLDNSSSGFMAYDWHMFSSALTAANMGLEYHSGVGDNYYVKNNYSTLLANGISNSIYNAPANMDPTKTTWSTSSIGYFPTNTPYGTWRGTADSNGSFDFYCYSEPYAHWINFKREGVTSFFDHWHQNEDANHMHQNIPYENELTMTQGKGYMVALSKPSMLMADGVLNNGDASGNVSAAVTATTFTTDYESGLSGVNLIGNPYQSYLNFDQFAGNSNNADVNNTYYILDADHHGYVSYTVGQSDALAPRVLHPHQGFIVKVSGSRNLQFTPSMRATTGADFREEGQHYPLVNLFCADAQDRRDYATVELDRPEVGGGEKVAGLHAGDASVWIHYDDADWQTAFTTPGLHEVPVRFKAYADGFFTMGWETLNGDFSYMHLIDNMTGMDVDCLSAREYHFEGKVNDYVSRFRLVFEYTDVDENDATVEDQNFAFMNGDELVVNVPSTGSGALLQVFDLNGRCVFAQELFDVQSTVSLPGLTSGVYILRLTGSQCARTQKMVIK